MGGVGLSSGPVCCRHYSSLTHLVGLLHTDYRPRDTEQSTRTTHNVYMRECNASIHGIGVFGPPDTPVYHIVRKYFILT